MQSMLNNFERENCLISNLKVMKQEMKHESLQYNLYILVLAFLSAMRYIFNKELSLKDVDNNIIVDNYVFPTVDIVHDCIFNSHTVTVICNTNMEHNIKVIKRDFTPEQITDLIEKLK